MTTLRTHTPAEIAGQKVIGWSDYQESVRYDGDEKSEITLPKSDVLMYEMENGCKAVIRPSGTEPKIKIYYFVVRENESSAREKEKELQNSFTKLLRV